MSQTIQLLIIHCTATPEGREVTSDDIRKWHLSPISQGGRGWKQVGYTDLIKINGTIERLVTNNEDNIVDSWEITNGVTGKNSISRHIVYAGGTDKALKSKDTRTPQQKEALRKYILDFVKRFPNTKIAGHYQFANKACPSFDVPKFCREIGVPEKNIYQSSASSITNLLNNGGQSGNNIKLNVFPPIIGLIGASIVAYLFFR